ncbi:hypothetical protein RhiirC2_791582 [Rhizophagus irregularis]|uniref:Uncharacterized protein n=1 Tax=Rhizophagus irregularis TaxID=588596 RepID=A0A2N1MIY3_9GLOM|nr:hypothetical protein RhiirC2_791582 [Rhizophagus irregularis]
MIFSRIFKRISLDALWPRTRVNEDLEKKKGRRNGEREQKKEQEEEGEIEQEE